MSPAKKSKVFFMFSTLILAALVLSACGGQTAATQVPTSAATVDPGSLPAGTPSFASDVLPILQNSCVNCHGGERTSKGLDLKSYDSLMAGSSNGAVVVAGDPANSKLLQLVLSGKMPKRGDALAASQSQIISDWIKAGAPNN